MKTNYLKANFPGKKGAIARLIVLTLCAVIGLVVSFGTIGQYVPKRGLGQAILDAFFGCGTIFLVGAIFWGMMKWIGFIAPKSFRLANAFWRNWIPLTFLGLYLKVCIWLIIVVTPCSMCSLAFSGLLSVGMFLLEDDSNVFLALGFFLLSAAVVALLGFWDIMKLRRGASAS